MRKHMKQDSVTKKCAILTAENMINEIECLVIKVKTDVTCAKVFKLEGDILTYTDMDTGISNSLPLSKIDQANPRFPPAPPTDKMLKCIQAMIEVAAEEIGYEIVGGELELVVIGLREFTLQKALWKVEAWRDDTQENHM